MTKLQRAAAVAAPIARDLIGLGGLVLVVAGLAQLSVAIATIVAGAILIGLAWIWAKRG